MTLSTKAIFAALILSLTPGLASATGVNNTFAGGAIFSPLQVTGGVAQNPTGGTQWIPSPINGGQPGPTQGLGCGAHYAQSLIGLNVSYTNIPGHVRIIGPHTNVTFDYRPNRLNLRTDFDGTITRVYCG